MKIIIFDLEKKTIRNQTQLIYFLKSAAPKLRIKFGLGGIWFSESNVIT